MDICIWYILIIISVVSYQFVNSIVWFPNCIIYMFYKVCTCIGLGHGFNRNNFKCSKFNGWQLSTFYLLCNVVCYWWMAFGFYYVVCWDFLKNLCTVTPQSRWRSGYPLHWSLLTRQLPWDWQLRDKSGESSQRTVQWKVPEQQ